MPPTSGTVIPLLLLVIAALLTLRTVGSESLMTLLVLIFSAFGTSLVAPGDGKEMVDSFLVEPLEEPPEDFPDVFPEVFPDVFPEEPEELPLLPELPVLEYPPVSVPPRTLPFSI